MKYYSDPYFVRNIPSFIDTVCALGGFKIYFLKDAIIKICVKLAYYMKFILTS